MKEKWAFSFSKRMLFLLIVCIAINILGRFSAKQLNLPFWLDSIGTGVTACLGGPVLGGICGLCTNLIVGIKSIEFVYAVTNMGLGIAIGLCARSGYMNEFFGVLCTSMIAGIVSVMLSTPLNLIFYKGYTGNIWGNGLVDLLESYHVPYIVRSFLGQSFVDIPDKVITLVAIYGVLKLIKRYGKGIMDKDAREEHV